MYLVKNAFISLKRNKGRNLLIGIIVFVIACTSTIALSITNSADRLIASYESQYEVTATIGVNREAMMNELKEEGSVPSIQDKFSEIENLTEKEIIEYGTSDYVKSYYYTMSIGLNGSGVEPTSNSFEANHMGKGPEQSNFLNVDFNLVGYSSLEAMTEFIEGKYIVTEGSADIEFDSETCLINYELANFNSLKVGDRITLVNPNNALQTYTLIIAGIYKENEESNETRMNLFSTSSNTIITNVNMVKKIVTVDDSYLVDIMPTFVLNRVDIISAFEEELQDKGLNQYFMLSTNLDQMTSATRSVSNLKTFAMTFLMITFVIGAIVLVVINMIHVRERKYEIGVLRTIGMKKSRVVCQFMMELLMVTTAMLLIGAGVGSFLSVPTANMLLKQEIASSEASKTQVRNNFRGQALEQTEKQNMELSMDHKMENLNGIINIEGITSIHAAVDMKVILKLLGLGMILTFLGSSVAMTMILKFSPLEILKERSSS